jgi:hypothetical protein
MTIVINSMTKRLPSDVRMLRLFSEDMWGGKEKEMGGACSTNWGEEERV